MEIWHTKDVDRRISHMVESFRRSRSVPQKLPRPFITLSREYGCDAYELGVGLSERINTVFNADPPWTVYDRHLVERVAGDMQITEQIVKSMATEHRTALEQFLGSMVLKIPTNDVIFERTARVIRGLAWNGNAVIIGRGAPFLTRGLDLGFHIAVVAPFAWRLDNLIAKHLFKSRSEGEKRLIELDRERRAFYQHYFEVDIGREHPFDLMINNASFPAARMVDLAMAALSSHPRQVITAA